MIFHLENMGKLSKIYRKINCEVLSIYAHILKALLFYFLNDLYSLEYQSVQNMQKPKSKNYYHMAYMNPSVKSGMCAIGYEIFGKLSWYMEKYF